MRRACMARLESHFEPSAKGEAESPFNEADLRQEPNRDCLDTEIGRLDHRLCCSAEARIRKRLDAHRVVQMTTVSISGGD